MSGTCDHIPASVFEAWPKLIVHQNAVASHPAIRQYFATS